MAAGDRPVTAWPRRVSSSLAISAQAGEALATFDHGAEGQCLEAVEIGQTGGVSPIRPTVPQRMQGVADLGVGVTRARLDACSHRIGGQPARRAAVEAPD